MCLPRSAKPCVSNRSPQNAAAGTGRRCPEGEGSSGRGAASRSWESSVLAHIPSLPWGAGLLSALMVLCEEVQAWLDTARGFCPAQLPSNHPGDLQGAGTAHQHRSQASPSAPELCQPISTSTGRGSLGAAEHPKYPPEPTPASLGLGKAQGPPSHLGHTEPRVRTGTGTAHAGPAPSGSIPRSPYQQGSVWQCRKKWKRL